MLFYVLPVSRRVTLVVGSGVLFGLCFGSRGELSILPRVLFCRSLKRVCNDFFPASLFSRERCGSGVPHVGEECSSPPETLSEAVELGSPRELTLET